MHVHWMLTLLHICIQYLIVNLIGKPPHPPLDTLKFSAIHPSRHSVSTLVVNVARLTTPQLTVPSDLCQGMPVMRTEGRVWRPLPSTGGRGSWQQLAGR